MVSPPSLAGGLKVALRAVEEATVRVTAVGAPGTTMGFCALDVT
jgi:hypothetical protein